MSAASIHSGPLDHIELFAYRTSTLESEVIKPLVLYLLDPNAPTIQRDQVEKALSAVESWMVRRMLLRETTKNYNQVVSELLAHLRNSFDRSRAGDMVEAWLAGQTGSSTYWPDDEDVRTELLELPAYRRLGRGRLRMVLEAVEDDLRGWTGGRAGFAADRVLRASHAIEHVMPRKWTSHWRNTAGFVDDAERDHLVHTLGNLTLLTKRLNSTVSNSRWKTKRAHLHKREPLLLTRDLLEAAGDAWTGDLTRARTRQLVEVILKVWPVPSGHRSGFTATKGTVRLRKVSLADLISAGFLEPGISLIPRVKRFEGRVATLLSDGDIDVDGERYSTPADAAAAIAGKKRNGMWFFLVSQEPRRSLGAVKREYLERIVGDAGVEDDEGDEE